MCDSGVIIFEESTCLSLRKESKARSKREPCRGESHVTVNFSRLSLLEKKEQKRPLRRLKLKRQKEVTYGLKFALNNRNATEWCFFVKTN